MTIDIAVLMTSILIVIGSSIAVIEFPRLYITSVLVGVMVVGWTILYMTYGKI